jgi:rhodanese-related sulfurtransferase
MPEAEKIEIDAAGLRDLIATGSDVELVDVREAWETGICRIADSKTIPLSELPVRCGELSRDRPLVMICHHGMRSLNATIWLRRNGYDNAINLAGGIDAWAREIDPAMARY